MARGRHAIMRRWLLPVVIVAVLLGAATRLAIDPPKATGQTKAKR